MDKPVLPAVQIIVPCYNPQPQWHFVLAERYLELKKALEDQAALSLILIEDGATGKVLPEHIAGLKTAIPELIYRHFEQNRGKGAALRSGVELSTAPYLLLTDVDFPYTVQSMADVVQEVIQRQGIVSGHREQSYYERVPWFRRILSKALRFLLKYLMRLPVEDSQCGLKAMDAQGKAVFLKTTINRYLFDLEFLQLAYKRVPVRPVRVELREGITFTTMGFGILKTEFGNFLRLLFRVSS